MAYSETQWEKAKGYYEAGLSLSKITEKTTIARNTISQRAKREQWEHGKNADYIEAKELIATKKGTEKEQAVLILDEIADENIRRKNLVYGASEKIVQATSKMLDKGKKQVVVKVKEYSKESGSSESLDVIDQELDPQDLKNLSDTVDKASLTLGVNPRHAPKIELNNTNAQQNNTETKRVTIARRSDRND